MNYANFESESESADRSSDARSDREFKKLKRPIHSAKRSKLPERLHGIHRRRRKRIDW